MCLQKIVYFQKGDWRDFLNYTYNTCTFLHVKIQFD